MRADTHVLGSSDGYKTIIKSRGITALEEGELTVLNFGQAENSDMQSLRASPTVHGRVLPGGRYALTKYVPAAVDDVGRPTIQLRSLVMDLSAFDQHVRGRLAQFIHDDSVWMSREFESGGPLNLPARCAPLAPIASDYSLLDAAHGSRSAGAVALVEGGQSGSDALIHMIGAVDSSEISSVSWGTSLLSTGVDASIATLMMGRRPDGRRAIRSCGLNSDITSLAIKSSYSAGRPPSSVIQAPVPSATTSQQGAGWGQTTASPYGLSDGEERVNGEDSWNGAAGDSSAVSGERPEKSKTGGFPIALLAGAACFFLLVIGALLALTFFAPAKLPGVIALEEYQSRSEVPDYQWTWTGELEALSKLREPLLNRELNFGLEGNSTEGCSPEWNNQSLESLDEALSDAIVACISVSSDQLESHVMRIECLRQEIQDRVDRLAAVSEQSGFVKGLPPGSNLEASLAVFRVSDVGNGTYINIDEDLKLGDFQDTYNLSVNELKEGVRQAKSWSSADEFLANYVQTVDRLYATQNRIKEQSKLLTLWQKIFWAKRNCPFLR